MGKRGNENNQMRKEEYEALEDAGGGSEPTGSFEKANEDTLKRRKIVKPRRPPGSSPPTSSGKSGGSLFGSVNFGGGIAGFGGGTPAPAKKGPAFSLVGKPITAAPASSASSPPAQPALFFGQPQPSNRQKKSAPIQEDPVVSRLADGLKEYFDQNVANTPRVIPTRALDIVLTTLNAHVNKHALNTKTSKESLGNGASSAAAANAKQSSASTFGSNPVAAAKPPASASSPSTSGPLFGSNTSTSSNLFGGAFSAAKPNFAFGGNGNKEPDLATTSDSTSGLQFQPSQPASAPSPVPFSFSSFTPATATTEPTTKATTDLKSSDVTNDNSTDVEDRSVEEAVDPDYDTVARIPKAKLRRLEDGKYAEIGTGSLKIERHKTNDTTRLVLRNLGSGAIMANLSIDSHMVTLKKSDPGEKKQKGQIVFKSKLNPTSPVETLYLLTKFEDLDETFNKMKGK